MKNKSRLTITLYVFTILSLVYTTYYLFSTYTSVSQYYSSYNVSFGTIMLTVLSSVCTPFFLTCVLYGLAGVSDMCSQILDAMTVEEEEQEVQEESKEAEGN